MSKTKDKKETESLSIRFPIDVHRYLVETSKSELRSINSLVVLAVKEQQERKRGNRK